MGNNWSCKDEFEEEIGFTHVCQQLKNHRGRHKCSTCDTNGFLIEWGAKDQEVL